MIFGVDQHPHTQIYTRAHFQQHNTSPDFQPTPRNCDDENDEQRFQGLDGRRVVSEASWGDWQDIGHRIASAGEHCAISQRSLLAVQFSVQAAGALFCWVSSWPASRHHPSISSSSSLLFFLSRVSAPLVYLFLLYGHVLCLHRSPSSRLCRLLLSLP